MYSQSFSTLSHVGFINTSSCLARLSSKKIKFKIHCKIVSDSEQSRLQTNMQIQAKFTSNAYQLHFKHWLLPLFRWFLKTLADHWPWLLHLIGESLAFVSLPHSFSLSCHGNPCVFDSFLLASFSCLNWHDVFAWKCRALWEPKARYPTHWFSYTYTPYASKPQPIFHLRFRHV